jgi:hypothetical protein
MLTLALYFPASPAISLLQESIGSDFSDLGRKLLGGFAAAVVVAVAYTVIKLRLRDKNPPKAFISVTSCKDDDTTPK